ncbi:MAG: TlpA family protein disulfide reductase [Candidatus Thorarchaeota archaeon]|nr:TlpA family protein disulfide reductase [Candidatus Thorarchaeota archaeon]
METEKLLIVVVISSVVVVGMVIGVTFLAFDNPYSGNTTSPTTSSGIAMDIDLLGRGIQLPDWNLLMSDDSIQTLHSLRGKFLVIDLMATWCTSCESQNSDFLTLRENLGDSIEIISLSVDVSETTSMLADYAEDRNLPWPHGLDTNSVFANYFNVRYVPSTVVIDNSGYLRWFHEGMWPASAMMATLNQLMP